MSEEEVKVEDEKEHASEDYKKAYDECVEELKRYQQLVSNLNLDILRLARIVARQEGALNG